MVQCEPPEMGVFHAQTKRLTREFPEWSFPLRVCFRGVKIEKKRRFSLWVRRRFFIFSEKRSVVERVLG